MDDQVSGGVYGSPGKLAGDVLDKTHGAPADLVVYSDDPRGGADVLSNPELVILRGRVTDRRGRAASGSGYGDG